MGLSTFLFEQLSYAQPAGVLLHRGVWQRSGAVSNIRPSRSHPRWPEWAVLMEEIWFETRKKVTNSQEKRCPQ